jgi:hypothetical protein
MLIEPEGSPPRPANTDEVRACRAGGARRNRCCGCFRTSAPKSSRAGRFGSTSTESFETTTFNRPRCPCQPCSPPRRNTSLADWTPFRRCGGVGKPGGLPNKIPRRAHGAPGPTGSRVGLPARSAIIDVLRECLIHFLNGEQRCRLGSHEARGRDG